MLAKRSRSNAQVMVDVTQAIDWLERQTFDDGVSFDALRYVDIVVSGGVESLSWQAGANLHFFLLQTIFKKAARMYPKTLITELSRQVGQQGFPSEDGAIEDVDEFDPSAHAVCLCTPSYLDALSSGQIGEHSNVIHFPHATIVWWGNSVPVTA